MTVTLAKDVQAFVEEQIRDGVTPDASTFVNDVLRSLSEHQKQPFAITSELEAWLLEAADSPVSPLKASDFDGIRERVLARVGGTKA